MSTTDRKTVVYTKSGRPVSVWESTAEPVSPDEMFRNRDKWLARNKHILEGFSSDEFVAWKRHEVEEGRL